MGKTLLFIGSEKAITNFYRYGYSEKFLSPKLIIATTKNIAEKFPRVKRELIFSTNWNYKDTSTLHLYFLFRNFFQKTNLPLSYELRNRLFGPYKITNPKIFFFSCKYFMKTFFLINWIFFLKNFKLSNHAFLKALREKNLIGLGDVEIYKNLIIKHSISKIITFTPFRDPKLYDLAEACEISNCELHIFPECWDNFSSGYGLPDKISKINVWSKQQLSEIKQFYPNQVKNVNIVGSYRRAYAAERVEPKKKLSSEVLRILYLEGYFYEDLNYVLNKILVAITNLGNCPKNIEITVRSYPLKRQTVNYQNRNTWYEKWIGKIDFNGINVIINKSFDVDLDFDFQDKDLVISELTTAGLEACFREIPTFFIGSHSSKRYLDSARAFNFSFANDLVKDGLYTNLSRYNGVEQFSRKLSLLMNQKINNLTLKENKLDIDFYSEIFNFEFWENLISSN